jgi:hypothetical protein
VDGINYHNATPADVAPNQWVFNHPFYLIMNLAIGGNFGGTVSPDLTFPQQMLVDYVRVYQAPNTSERFEASFLDDFSGWHDVSLPFSAFTRSATQPTGAPNDGLGLDEVWGYGVTLPSGVLARNSITLHMDQVRVTTEPTAVAFTEVSAGSPVKSTTSGLVGLGVGLLAAAGLAVVLARRKLA